MITLNKILEKIQFQKDEYSKESLNGFLNAQRLAYKCAVDIKKEAKPGWTEKQVASLMDTYLQDYKVKSFFHRSFAWFGDRSRFNNFNHYFKFLPSDRQLLEEDVVILDTAPIVNGYIADIGYTYSLVENDELKKAKKFLLGVREQIPKYFESNLTSKEIWEKVDKDFKDNGYINAHKCYPFSVLGHKVHYTKLGELPSVVIPFGMQAYVSLLSRGLLPQLLSPKYRVAKDGLWAIEPHLGVKNKNINFGAKFEEILVVKDGKARWLDDQVPHVVEGY